ncbi:MAG: HD-GYP domain-containing protein [Thermoleophilia bacterium]|nr:HD-GYP domain-containing protein [Thermoleophilia bacterium]
MPEDGRQLLPTLATPTTPWRWYRPAVWAFALATAALWCADSSPATADGWTFVAALVALGWVADLAAVRIQEGMPVSAAHFAAPFAVIAAGVPGGLAAATACLVGRALWNRRDWNSFDLAVNLTATSVAGAVWQISVLLPGPSVVLAAILTVTAFSATRALVNLGWSQEARSRGITIPAVTVSIGRLMLAAGLLFTPSIALLHADPTSPLSSLVLLALPFVATQFLFRSFGRERALNAELEAANISITESLVNALDARDPYSAGHSIAVAIYSRDIALEVRLDPADVQRTYLAGLLHDIGKIAVPDAILQKPGALTDDEFAEIRLHPVVGEEILRPSTHLADILPGVRHHHERIDGKGYPDRLRDAEIPLQARIIAIADAFNAMTSERPYREAMQPELAERILVQNQGMQHDPFLVAAFRRVLDRNGDEYRNAQGGEFDSSDRLRNVMHTHLRQSAWRDAA